MDGRINISVATSTPADIILHSAISADASTWVGRISGSYWQTI